MHQTSCSTCLYSLCSHYRWWSVSFFLLWPLLLDLILFRQKNPMTPADTHFQFLKWPLPQRDHHLCFLEYLRVFLSFECFWGTKYTWQHLYGCMLNDFIQVSHPRMSCHNDCALDFVRSCHPTMLVTIILL